MVDVRIFRGAARLGSDVEYGCCLMTQQGEPVPGATIVVIGTFAEGYEKFFAEYSTKIRAFLRARNATVIRRQLVERTLYGSSRPGLVMLIDIPSKEAAASIFFEKEYLDLISLRDKVFSDFQMFLAEQGEV